MKNEYERMYKLYLRGVITKSEWQEYCLDLLEYLMNFNKEVLDKLKAL